MAEPTTGLTPELEVFPMPITKPVRWEWSSSNVISIYEPTDSVHGGRVFTQIWEGLDVGSWEYDSKEQMEETAAFIASAINAALREARPDA